MKKLTIYTLSLVLLVSCNKEDEGFRYDDIVFSQVSTTTQLPSNVTVAFKADTEDESPLSSLDNTNFTLYENDDAINAQESKLQITRSPSNFMYTAMLVIDLSGSVLADNTLGQVKDAARTFVDSYLSNDSQNAAYELSIYWFDGEEALHQLSGFSNNKVFLNEKIASITEDISTDNSTNLNGAIVQGIDIMENRLSTLKTRDYILVAGAMVLFTDGVDQAGRVTLNQATSAVSNSMDELSLFTIGLGSEVNKGVLADFGKTGAEFANNLDELTQTFDAVANNAVAVADSYYIIQYCSPKRSGDHDFRIDVIYNNYKGSIEKNFNATGFSGGCTVD